MRLVIALAVPFMFAAVLPSAAVADPVRLLPNGDIEFDVHVSTSAFLGCHNTEYVDYWNCQRMPDGSVEIRNGDATATIAFVGLDQTVAVAANSLRRITLGEIVGEATPGFVFPALPSPQWALLSLNLSISHVGDGRRETSFVSWGFAPGGSGAIPFDRGDFATGVSLTSRPDPYDYEMVAYQFSTITATSIQANGRTAIVADVNAIPEPGTLVLIGTGLVALSRARRRRLNLDGSKNGKGKKRE